MEALIIVRYLHFVAIFGVVSAVVAQHMLIKEQMTRAEIKRISAVDGIYGISALVVLGVGLTLWFFVGNPSGYYTSNWIFHLKVGLFLIVGLISIIPTTFYLKNRKGTPTELVAIPRQLKMVIRLELLLLFLIPLLATLMANGVGSF
jgi:putative membrane protein